MAGGKRCGQGENGLEFGAAVVGFAVDPPFKQAVEGETSGSHYSIQGGDRR